ncbi:hypothetical protein PoB_005316700 [Plakobranchus ocellatus]|uniref:Uncharacterized protein n=1 Tax=Plakobranchus ocellatus TaxID=259542 RepID=A0AAV4C5L5_9GAST|nr:hypothetical protein PoB_005316700 [Plakobranchus ocellatus]
MPTECFSPQDPLCLSLCTNTSSVHTPRPEEQAHAKDNDIHYATFLRRPEINGLMVIIGLENRTIPTQSPSPARDVPAVSWTPRNQSRGVEPYVFRSLTPTRSLKNGSH